MNRDRHYGIGRPTLLRAAHAFATTLGIASLLLGTAHAAPGGRPGQTELQSNTGTAISTIWGALNDQNGADGLTGDTAELFLVCTRVIHSANDLDDTGNTDRSLGISESELNATLQQLTGEELASVRSFATELSSGQEGNVTARVADLRIGGPAQRAGGAAGLDDGEAGRWGSFVNGTVSGGEKDATEREDGFDFDTGGITAGVDYRFSANMFAGVALGYDTVASDFQRSATVAGGGVDLDGYSVSTYATFYEASFYVDALLGYGQTDYDITRRIDFDSNTAEPGSSATAESSTDGDYVSAALGAGYELVFGAWSVSPYARTSYLDLTIDAYTERGAGALNLEVDDQDVSSLTTVLGGRIAYAISRNFGVLVPQARLEWIHEFDDDATVLRSRYVAAENFASNEDLVATTDAPTEDYAALSLGVSSVFRSGIQSFIEYQTWLGLDDIDEHIVSAGVRLEF